MRGMPPPLTFISYRRSDAQQAALGLYYQLRARLGIASIFMDRSGISGGEMWAHRLRDSLNRATVVLALIGPGWLRAADEHGRRRLDLPDDWVRTELETALKAGKTIIPVLLGDAAAVPAKEGLPSSLMELFDSERYHFHEDQWEANFDGFVRLLVEKYGFQEEPRVPAPDKIVKPKTLTPSDLEQALEALPGWEQVESFIPGDYPKTRHEIRKAFIFQTFREAMGFMIAAIPAVNQLEHHPRWENQWRTVTVYLSTWDIESKISHLDIELAGKLDELYSKATRKR
jgi:pterin-4a-carbinolamine dehydratase